MQIRVEQHKELHQADVGQVVAVLAGEAVEEEEEAVEALEDDSERPEWLPEKFKNPEDLAKAYGELEKKMGEPSEEGDEAAPSKEAMSLESLNKYSEEFNEKGELSEDSYSDLEKLGLNKDLVDAFAEGQLAIQKQQEQLIYNEVGGEENYRTMAQWAEETLSPEELASFNNVVVLGGDTSVASMTVKGLYARYQSEAGTAPALMKGTPSAEALMPFQSNEQVITAMANPKYKTDAAYRREVEQRLAVSNVF